jgi:hypothetical protein
MGFRESASRPFSVSAGDLFQNTALLRIQLRISRFFLGDGASYVYQGAKRKLEW